MSDELFDRIKKNIFKLKKVWFSRLEFARMFIYKYKQGVKPAKSFGYVGGKQYFYLKYTCRDMKRIDMPVDIFWVGVYKC